jgi:hypothetical protein
MRPFLYSLLLLILFAACSEKNTDGMPPTPTPNPCGSVSGVHHTDNMGVLMYPADSTDWRSTDAWCPAVEALFADLPPVTYAEAPADPLWIGGFPNPAQTQFALGFSHTDGSRVDVRFVDSSFQLLFSRDSLMANVTLFQNDSIASSNAQVVRAYYRITHPDGTAHRGHGDIQLGL